MRLWMGRGRAVVLAALVAVPMAVMPAAPAAALVGAGTSPAATLRGAPPLAAVSCTTSLFCAAVDKEGRAYVWRGSSWSHGVQLAYAPPAGAPRPGTGVLENVSCV